MDKYLLEDGSGYYRLEDDSGDLLIEDGAPSTPGGSFGAIVWHYIYSSLGRRR